MASTEHFDMWKIDIPRRVDKELDKIPSLFKKMLEEKIANLRVNPRPNGVTKLSGKEYWRVRVGPYRIVYKIDDQTHVIGIVKIAHRKDVYRILHSLLL